MVGAETLLRVWEHGKRGGAARRAIELLALALPDRDRQTLAAFDLGLRDWHLLQLRLAWFGPELTGRTECPQCGERLEVELDAGAAAAEPALEGAPLFTTRDGHRFRLPTVGDLAVIDSEADPETAAVELFRRCSVDDLPVEADGPSMFEEADSGLAAIALERGLFVDVSCALCGAHSRQALDPGEFLWSEIEARAGRLLDEVHLLAAAYGWPEREILALSPARRAAYLNRAAS
jgi:hypothetical protein